MIFEVLKILSEEVETYIGSTVKMENVAMLDSQSDNPPNLGNKVLLTLLNINEEMTMKNFPNQSIRGNRLETRPRVINLNLFILFCANRTSYDQALIDIANIIEFFQGKKVFTQSNTVYNHQSVELKNIDNFRFTVELYTPTFEELNYIWGSLGGKQLPSVLYKLSLVQIERETILGQSGQVVETKTDSHLKQ